MDDFESELSGLFEEAVDPSVGAPLAGVALARIRREDDRRGLALTTAGVIGVAAAASVIGASGAVRAIRDLVAEAVHNAPHTLNPEVLWPMAAIVLAGCAVQALRTARAL